MLDPGDSLETSVSIIFSTIERLATYTPGSSLGVQPTPGESSPITSLAGDQVLPLWSRRTQRTGRSVQLDVATLYERIDARHLEGRVFGTRIPGVFEDGFGFRVGRRGGHGDRVRVREARIRWTGNTADVGRTGIFNFSFGCGFGFSFILYTDDGSPGLTYGDHDEVDSFVPAFVRLLDHRSSSRSTRQRRKSEDGQDRVEPDRSRSGIARRLGVEVEPDFSSDFAPSRIGPDGGEEGSVGPVEFGQAGVE